MSEQKPLYDNSKDFEDDLDVTNVPVGKVNRQRPKTTKFPQHGSSLKRVIVPTIKAKAKAIEAKAKYTPTK